MQRCVIDDTWERRGTEGCQAVHGADTLLTAFMLMGNIGTGIGAALLGAVSTASGYAAAYALAGGVTLLALLIHFPYWHQRAGN